MSRGSAQRPEGHVSLAPTVDHYQSWQSLLPIAVPASVTHPSDRLFAHTRVVVPSFPAPRAGSDAPLPSEEYRELTAEGDGTPGVGEADIIGNASLEFTLILLSPQAQSQSHAQPVPGGEAPNEKEKGLQQSPSPSKGSKEKSGLLACAPSRKESERDKHGAGSNRTGHTPVGHGSSNPSRANWSLRMWRCSTLVGSLRPSCVDPATYWTVLQEALRYGQQERTTFALFPEDIESLKSAPTCRLEVRIRAKSGAASITAVVLNCIAVDSHEEEYATATRLSSTAGITCHSPLAVAQLFSALSESIVHWGKEEERWRQLRVDLENARLALKSSVEDRIGAEEELMAALLTILNTKKAKIRQLTIDLHHANQKICVLENELAAAKEAASRVPEGKSATSGGHRPPAIGVDELGNGDDEEEEEDLGDEVDLGDLTKFAHLSQYLEESKQKLRSLERRGSGEVEYRSQNQLQQPSASSLVEDGKGFGSAERGKGVWAQGRSLELECSSARSGSGNTRDGGSPALMQHDNSLRGNRLLDLLDMKLSTAQRQGEGFGGDARTAVEHRLELSPESPLQHAAEDPLARSARKRQREEDVLDAPI